MGLAVAVRIASDFTGRVLLPVFPFVLERLIQTRHEPSADASTLSRLIELDPSLCLMAMHLDHALTAQPQFTSQSDGIAAANRIGMGGIDVLIASALAGQALNGVSHYQGLSLGWLWAHCLTTALLARELALVLDYQPIEEAYVAGLLHDIGKLALFSRTPASCAPMLTDARQAGPLLEAEEQVAGAHHDRIGAHLIRRYSGAWHASDAARYHRASVEKVKQALPLVQIVWAANRLAGDVHGRADTAELVAGLLNLSSRQVHRLVRQADAQTLAAADELGVTPVEPEEGRLFDEPATPLKQEIRNHTLLSSMYAQLLTAPDHDAIIQILRLSLVAFLGIDTLIILGHNPDEETLTVQGVAGSRMAPHVGRLKIPLSASQCLACICHNSGTAVHSFSRDRQAALTIVDQQLMAVMQADGIVCVPVSRPARGRASTLILGIDRLDWPWIESQMPLLTTIAGAMATALDRISLPDRQVTDQATQELAAVTSKTRKVVHEINNPLSIIKNYLNVLARRSDEHPSDAHELRIINEEINRVSDLVKSLSLPSDSVPLRVAAVDVNATITDMLRLIRESIPETTDIRLVQDLDENLPAIASDRDRLKQALMNLLKNATEAMPGGGTIRVSTRLLIAPEHPVDSDHTGHRIKISVCDDGPGIDERIKNDLFKPHVTSKSDHNGLGLAIVEETLNRLHGTLACESTPGKGTCFHIELPTGNQAV
jgi:putative nucleotidyltransferase with HDIG domain